MKDFLRLDHWDQGIRRHVVPTPEERVFKTCSHCGHSKRASGDAEGVVTAVMGLAGHTIPG